MIKKYLPEIFQIEITSVCNMHCNFCPHPSMVRSKKHMSMEVFAKASQYFVRGQTLGLYMMGDPLLHPKLLDMIDTAVEKGCKPEIATNSLAFNNGTLRTSVLLSGLQYIILDMSRWKESPAVMDRAFANIEELVKDYRYLARMERTLPTLAFQIVTNPKAPQDFPEFVKLLAHDFPKKALLKRKFLDTWAGQMKELYDYTDVKPPEVRTPCHEPFERVAMLQNGDVVPCCRDANGMIVYGNIMSHSLLEIWEGPVASKVRSLMINNQNDLLPEPCRSCREYHYPMNRHIATKEGGDEGVTNA